MVDSDRDVVRDRDDLPAPEETLSRVLARRDVDRLSAHQVISDSLHEVSSLARLGAIFEDAARSATDQCLRRTLIQRGLDTAIDDAQWPSLIARVRETALAGHDVAVLVEEAIRMRPIVDVHSTAAVLHWRLGVLGATPAPLPRGPLLSLPPSDGPAIEVARQAGELIRQRWRDLRASLAATPDPLSWAPALGPQPPDPGEEAAWLTAATAVTAYRARYDIPNHIRMLGPRPAASRPDARAAWDHACLQADRYLARHLRNLDDQQLVDLDVRQQVILDNPSPFDPAELERARRRLDAAQRPAAGQGVDSGKPHAANTSHYQVLGQRLERAAQAHRDWGRAATKAQAIRRVELQRRGTSRARTLTSVLTR